MPRNDGMENEVQAEYPDHGALRDAAAELSNLFWVRFTERTRAPRDRRKLWLLLVLVLLAHALLGWFVWQFVHPVRYRHEEKKDRKSTRLNSSHMSISYAVFCLKKKKKKKNKN